MSNKVDHTISQATRRKLRVRAKLHGTAARPRATVYRSNQHTYLQAIDDVRGVTLAAAGEHELTEKTTKAMRAVAVAKILAEKLKKENIEAVVFDRGSYKYHGRVKAVADALRESGIQV